MVYKNMGVRFFFIIVVLLMLISDFLLYKSREELITNIEINDQNISKIQENLGISLEGFIKGTEGNRYTAENAKIDFQIRDEKIREISIKIKELEEKIKIKNQF